MALYRKLPVEIEAVRVTAADFNGHDWDGSPFSEMPDWLAQAIRDGRVYPDTPNGTDYAEWQIATLEGEMLAGPDDWIIRGVAGELYPCKPDIFARTYERVGGSGEAVAPMTAGESSRETIKNTVEVEGE